MCERLQLPAVAARPSGYQGAACSQARTPTLLLKGFIICRICTSYEQVAAIRCSDSDSEGLKAGGEGGEGGPSFKHA